MGCPDLGEISHTHSTLGCPIESTPQLQTCVCKFRLFKTLAGLFCSKGSGIADGYRFGHEREELQPAASPRAEQPSCRVLSLLNQSVRLPSAPLHHRAVGERAGRSSRKLSPAGSTVLPSASHPSQVTPSPPRGISSPTAPVLQEDRDQWGWKPQEGQQHHPAHVQWRFLSVWKT